MTSDLRPILIGGCARSGTTLMLSILSAHPWILAVPFETEAFCPGAYSAKPDLSAPFRPDIIENWMRGVTVPAQTRFWCEKTPRNVLFLGRILEFFGSPVRFLTLVRDGRDVITSRHPRNPERFWVSPERWIQDVGAGLPYDAHPMVLAVRYEDLVTDFRATVGRVCTFLEIPSVESLNEWPRNATVGRHPAWFSDAGPIHPDSIGRWAAAEHRERIRNLMERPKAVNLLKHYGYITGHRKAQGTRCKVQ